MPKKYVILMTTGTNDALKTELAVVCGFSLRKAGNDVTFLQMGEAGSVIDTEILMACNGFGLPPIAKPSEASRRPVPSRLKPPGAQCQAV